MGQKLALIIGNSDYEDQKLTRLKTPDADVNALVSVLSDPKIGDFSEVVPLVNQPELEVRRAIARFFAKRMRNDLLLLYFSGHGVLDDSGLLYLAVKDTEIDLLSATAIPAAFVTSQMDKSRSQRQVLILDCCHSGAFARAKGALGTSVGTKHLFEGTGYGRVVLTATDSTQYAWEGDQVVGKAENSVFTHYLIQGIRTGEADLDADGKITLDELYEYVYEHVVTETSRQAPGKWSYKQQGEIVIARNPHPVVKLVELPDNLQQTLESSFPAEPEQPPEKIEPERIEEEKVAVASGPTLWQSTWRIAIGWGIVWFAELQVFDFLRGEAIRGSSLFMGLIALWVLGGVTGGVVARLVLRREGSSIRWWRILTIAIIWFAGWHLFFSGFFVDISRALRIGFFIPGAIGGGFILSWLGISKWGLQERAHSIDGKSSKKAGIWIKAILFIGVIMVLVAGGIYFYNAWQPKVPPPTPTDSPTRRIPPIPSPIPRSSEFSTQIQKRWVDTYIPDLVQNVVDPQDGFRQDNRVALLEGLNAQVAYQFDGDYRFINVPDQPDITIYTSNESRFDGPYSVHVGNSEDPTRTILGVNIRGTTSFDLPPSLASVEIVLIVNGHNGETYINGVEGYIRERD